MTQPDTSTPAVEAMIASLRLSSAQPLRPYTGCAECCDNEREQAAAMLAALAAKIERLTKTIRMSGDSAGEMISALSAELATLAAERDEARRATKDLSILLTDAKYEGTQAAQKAYTAGLELAAAREALAKAVEAEREALEMAEALLSRPLTRDLETGFRHSPLTNAERDKRYAETCKFALEHVQAAIRARKEPTP